jgi:uncharacterized protein (TIGR02284 family)
MIHPGSLDSETIERLRKLIATTYGGRDDLYAAANQLNDEDLSAICRKLADDLAGDTAYLEQIIVMHGQQPEVQNAVTSTLSEAIMKLLRKSRGDEGIVSAAKQRQSQLRQRYNETIAATGHPEAHAILDEQKKHVEFAERVLRQVRPTVGGDAPSERRPRDDG